MAFIAQICQSAGIVAEGRILYKIPNSVGTSKVSEIFFENFFKSKKLQKDKAEGGWKITE